MYSIFAYRGKKQVHLKGCFVQWREGFVQWRWKKGLFLEEIVIPHRKRRAPQLNLLTRLFQSLIIVNGDISIFAHHT